MKQTLTFAPACFLLLASLAGPTATAQQSLPKKVALESFTKTRAMDFGDYTGRLVLIEFYATNSDASAEQVERLNGWEEDFGDQGFSVLAVTGAAPKLADAWMEKHGGMYAYAYDRGNVLAKWASVDGVPYFVLVGPKGQVIEKGDSRDLEPKTIKQHLRGVEAKPLWEWPKSVRSARKDWKKGDLAAALEKVGKLKDELQRMEFTSFLQAEITRALAKLEKLNSNGDFLGTYNLAQRLKKQLKGLPEGKRAAELASSIADSKDQQAVIVGQKALAKIVEQTSDPKLKAKQAQRFFGELEALSLKYPGTIVAKQAAELLERLKEI